jgi:shikimate 5-dehydrogenase
MPHTRSGLTPVQYSRWMDQHTAADVARSVAAALEAGKAAAAEVTDPGKQHVLRVMQQLCAAAAATDAVKAS